MNCLKTSFTIALLACFLTVKTNAQVGLTLNNIKKSVVIAPKKYALNLKPHPLNLPKISYAQNPYYLRQADNNALFNNSIEAIFSRNSSVLERAVGGLLLFAR